MAKYGRILYLVDYSKQIQSSDKYVDRDRFDHAKANFESGRSKGMDAAFIITLSLFSMTVVAFILLLILI